MGRQQTEVRNQKAVGHLDMGKLVVDIGLVQWVDIDRLQKMMGIGLVQLMMDTLMDLEHMDQIEVRTVQVVEVDIDLFEGMGSVGGSWVGLVDKHLALDTLVVLHYLRGMMDRVTGSQAVELQAGQGIPTKKQNSL